MKSLIFLLCFWILPLYAQTFLPGTEDIPLMAGLTQVEEMASFDNPAERMVLISAQTKLPPQKVFQFYQETLTNLGWIEKSQGNFERGMDSLLIEVNSTGVPNQIQFRLSQRNS